VITFAGAHPATVWLLACEHLLATPERAAFNMMLEFPCSAVSDDAALATYNPRRILGQKFDSASDVSNTIFPLKTRLNSASKANFYERYQRAHRRGRKKGWGTYFGRLISFGSGQINQLDRAIAALARWPGVHRAAIQMHISSPETDALRTRGGPCLQYIQLNCPSAGQVNMLAVYRNHDYCNKVLGNLFGLSRLLNFIGSESGWAPGQVSCLSAHAYLGTSDRNQRLLMAAR
jgi:thymidylate synthase